MIPLKCLFSESPFFHKPDQCGKVLNFPITAQYDRTIEVKVFNIAFIF